MPASGPTCVLFALRRESLYFRRRFPPYESCAAPCWASWCGARDLGLLVVETGVGATCTREALDWLLHDIHPARVLFAGFAGALSSEVHVGDVCWASEVEDTGGRVYLATWRHEH